MFKKFMLALAALLCIAASPAFAQGEKLGKGDYFVQVAPLVDADGNVTPQRLTTGQFDLIDKLDDLCRIDAKKYSPSEFKTVFITMLRNVPGAALGGGLGALAGGFTNSMISPTDYGLYNGIATAGGSFGNGFAAQSYGKKGYMGLCMTNAVTEVKRQQPQLLRRVYIIYNTFPVNGHAIKRSDLPNAPLPRDEDADNDQPASAQGEPAPPPPAH